MTHEPDPTVPRAATRAGEYDLIRKLGSGGFGVVFEARHRGTGLPYALKRLDLSADDAERYRNEALYPTRIASQSSHVLGVHSFFRDPDSEAFYLVTDLIPHGDLFRFLERHPSPLPLHQALEIGIGIAKGLAAIHAQGVIHRDLKPANVVMDQKDGQWVPKITDFGMARSSNSISIGDFASSGYAAPEQIDLMSPQEPLGPDSDLFSFGMILYELLTGTKPTDAKDLREYGRWIGARRAPAPPSAVRRELAAWPQIDTLTASLLEFDRTKRLASAGRVVQSLTSLRRALDSTPAMRDAPPPTASPLSVQEAESSEASDIARPDVLTPSFKASSIPAPSRVRRREVLPLMAVVFAITGIAMAYGLPWDNPSKDAPDITEPLFQHPDAPWFAHLSFVLLPMLFGLAFATAVRLKPAAVSIVCVLSALTYNVAAWLAIIGYSGLPLGAFLAEPAAGLVGAVGMLVAVRRWHSPTRRDIVFVAIAGLLGGILFQLSPLITEIFIAKTASRTDIAAGYAAWQIVVGLALVNRVLFGQAPRAIDHWPILPVMSVAGVALLGTAIGTWSRLSEPTKPGTTIKHTFDKVEYAWIPPGTFQIGCSGEDDECAVDEQPAHDIAVTKGFWLRTQEVTVSDWTYGQLHKNADGTAVYPSVAPLPPPADWNGLTYNKDWAIGDLPMVNVTWQEARDYCANMDGRLPTEAEWEYAARAGTTGARYGRLRDVARFADNSGTTELATVTMSDANLQQALYENRNSPASPRSSRNAWSVADMLGNVAEWTEDDYAETTYSLRAGVVSDPPAHRTGNTDVPKVVRGGSWASRPAQVRASARDKQSPTARSVFVGFRCVWNGPSQ